MRGRWQAGRRGRWMRRPGVAGWWCRWVGEAGGPKNRRGRGESPGARLSKRRGLGRRMRHADWPGRRRSVRVIWQPRCRPRTRRVMATRATNGECDKRRGRQTTRATNDEAMAEALPAGPTWRPGSAGPSRIGGCRIGDRRTPRGWRDTRRPGPSGAVERRHAPLALSLPGPVARGPAAAHRPGTSARHLRP